MDKLERDCELIRQKLREDWDWPVAISGYEGSGKSTLAFKMCKLVDPDFSIEEVVFSHEELIRKMASYSKYRAILLDEAGQSLFSREALTAINRELVKALMMVRAKNLFFCFCIPNFWWLDSYVRDHRTRLWIDVYTLNEERGWADFHIPLRDKWKDKPFWQNVYTYRFKKLKSKEWNEYEKYKLEAIQNRLTKERNNGFEITDRVKAIVLKYDAGWSISQIARYLKHTRDTIARYCKLPDASP